MFIENIEFKLRFLPVFNIFTENITDGFSQTAVMGKQINENLQTPFNLNSNYTFKLVFRQQDFA